MDEMKFQHLVAEFRDLLKPIKLVLLDADGILTTGHIFFAGQEVGFNRYFNVTDGFGVKMLMNSGLEVAVISGGSSLGLKERCKGMGVRHLYIGSEDKRSAYSDIIDKLNLKDEEVLYMADELFDVPILRRVGFSATVPHAPLEVKKIVNYVTNKKAGEGCVREVIDIVRAVQNIKSGVLDFNNIPID